MPKNDPNQSKFFGPKKGLNKAEAPLKRALPSGPNAGAPEFATEFKNFHIDPNDGVMKVRPGFCFINKNLSLPNIGELGIERFNNYNDKGEAEPVLLCLGRSNSYVVKKARVGISASSGQHKLTIIFHPTSGKYEVVHTNALTGAEIDRLSLNNVDLATLSASLTDLTIDFANDLYTDATYDGTDKLSNMFPIVDLEINASEDNEIHFDHATEIDTCVDLTAADINNASSTIAVFSEINNKMFISLPGLPLLKYEGDCISKAGLPDPDVVEKGFSLLSATPAHLDEVERESNPLWGRSDGSNQFALTNAQAGGTILKFSNESEAKVIDAYDSGNALDPGPEFNEAVIYAMAYQQGTLLSNAIGNERLEDNKIYLTKLDYDRASANTRSYIDKTITSGSQTIISESLQNTARISAKSLSEGNGWLVKGATVDNQGWIHNGDGDSSFGATNLTISISNNNFEAGDIGKKVYFNMTVVVRTTNGSVATYTQQQLLCQSELISYNASEMVVSKDLKVWKQPGGTEGVEVDVNYNDLTDLTFTGAGFIMGVMIYGAASIDTLINIYESEDSGDGGFTGGYEIDAFSYPQASFNLVAQLPNDPFGNSQLFFNYYDKNYFGDLYDSLNIVGNTNRSPDTLEEHSSLPSGRISVSHKGRLYITGDPDAINTVYGTSIVYGPEKYNVNGDDSFDIKDDIGDFITGLAPLGSALAVLKSNSTHVVQGDFATGNIRRDTITSEGFGCLSHHSISQVKDGIAYLSQEGVVYWGYDLKPQMLGSVYMNREAGSEPMSRIRGFLNDRALDFNRAISFNDNAKELYILYIPRTTEQSQGLIGVSKEGLTLVYDYMNDMWFEYTDYEFRSGAVYVNGTLYRAHSVGNGIDIASEVCEREWQTRTLYDYQDDFDAINYRYDSDWDSFLEPSVDKKPMHIKVFGYNLYDDILISSIPLDLDLTGKFSLKAEMYKDYRDDKLHTRNSMQINRRKLAARIKTKSQVVVSAKVSISNVSQEIFKCPCIMGIEVEYQVVHRGFQRPWSAS